METTLFTSAAVLDLLLQIEELQDKSMSLSDDGTNITITIGESQYKIVPVNATLTELETTPDAIEEIEDKAEDAISELSEEIVDDDIVEGGPIKSMLKTLLVGGMVKMGSKMIGKDIADAMIDEAIRRRNY